MFYSNDFKRICFQNSAFFISINFKAILIYRKKKNRFQNVYLSDPEYIYYTYLSISSFRKTISSLRLLCSDNWLFCSSLIPFTSLHPRFPGGIPTDKRLHFIAFFILHPSFLSSFHPFCFFSPVG